MRLQKFLSLCGVASRRKAEIFIKEGRVRVNGKVIIEMGYVLSPEDSVEFENKKIQLQEKAYIVLNKPGRIICSHSDIDNRRSVYDIIKRPDLKLFTVGRLDFFSSGLIIVTNDGDLSQSIIHPSNNVIKRYHLKCFHEIPDELILKFKSGISIDSMLYKAEDITVLAGNEAEISLKEGKNREIRTVFRHFNLKIRELSRISIGRMELKKLNLKPGEFVYLSKDRLEKLIFG